MFFILFCRRILLYKFRKHLKRQRLNDNEITDTFRRLSIKGQPYLASELLQRAITREVDVILTTGVRFNSN